MEIRPPDDSCQTNLRIFDLGTLGGSNSFAVDINNFKQITGFSETANGQVHAFLMAKWKNDRSWCT